MDPQRVDMEAIKALDARSSALRWGLVYQTGQRADRWALAGLERTATIQFYEDGRFTHHRLDVTGTIIDLVILYLCGAAHHDQSRVNDALHWIATRENLWIDYAPLRHTAHQLAIAPGGTTGEWMERIVAAIEHGQGFEDQQAQARRLMACLGVDWRKWTLAPQIMGDDACLCWMPAVPWHGQRTFRDQNGRFRGWTRKSGLAHWGGPMAGRVFVVDLDGAVLEGEGEPQRILPSVSQLQHLQWALARRGYPPRAIVISSWASNEPRGKAHLYFVSLKPASDEDGFKRWHKLLDEAIESIVRGWTKVPAKERDAFARDRGTHQISRLIRLPGFNKASKAAAGVLLSTFDGATIDFDRQWETRPIEIGDEVQRWCFGQKLLHFRQTKDGEESACVLATQVWPLAITVDIEDGSRGVRYRFHDDAGRARYGSLSAESWIDKSPARQAASEAARIGVDIKPWKGVPFAMALGQWASRADHPPIIATVRRAGWHDNHGLRAYVNGEQVHGAPWIYQGPGGRGELKGSLEAWRLGVQELVTTNGLWLALGCAFAGALLEPLRRDAFMLHFAGASRSGKSRASMLAASVWQDPRDILKYNGTDKGLTLAVERFDGACVVLDEIKEMPPHKVGQLIHTVTDGRSRTLAMRNGQEIASARHWSLVGLSTGEVTIAEYLGAATQGGHTVRGIDLRIQRGDCTIDADHADRLDRLMHGQYGCAGDAWVRWLVGLGDEDWRRMADAIDAMVAFCQRSFARNAEEQSILRSLAVVGVALIEAERAGVIAPSPCFTMEEHATVLVEWAMERITQERGKAVDPESRAFDAIRNLYQTHPALFPTIQEYRTSRAPQGIIGVSETFQDDDAPTRAARDPFDSPTGRIFTTEGMLKSCSALRQAGAGARRFLSWCKEQGLSSGSRRLRLGGLIERWHLIDLSDCDTSKEAQ